MFNEREPQDTSTMVNLKILIKLPSTGHKVTECVIICKFE